MVIEPGAERDLKDEFYVCTFCDAQVNRGAIWVGPNISLCELCVFSNHAAEMFGRIIGDALYSVYKGRSGTGEVERVTKQIEASIFRSLYCQALRGMKA